MNSRTQLMKAKVFGIPNCNSVKKARVWLKDNNIEEDFHDFKKQGIDKEHLTEWVNKFGWETVLNKKGTTWRTLNQSIKDKVVDEASAIEVMINNTSTIKRPIIRSKRGYTIGFDEDDLKSAHL